MLFTDPLKTRKEFFCGCHFYEAYGFPSFLTSLYQLGEIVKQVKKIYVKWQRGNFGPVMLILQLNSLTLRNKGSKLCDITCRVLDCLWWWNLLRNKWSSTCIRDCWIFFQWVQLISLLLSWNVVWIVSVVFIAGTTTFLSQADVIVLCFQHCTSFFFGISLPIP